MKEGSHLAEITLEQLDVFMDWVEANEKTVAVSMDILVFGHCELTPLVLPSYQPRPDQTRKHATLVQGLLTPLAERCLIQIVDSTWVQSNEHIEGIGTGFEHPPGRFPFTQSWPACALPPTASTQHSRQHAVSPCRADRAG
jgi:hypothetical protein